MTVTDNNLSALLAALRPSDRQAVERHLAGEKTPESLEALRKLRRRLKAKVRRRVPRLVWLA